jgi:hypothetical protein
MLDKQFICTFCLNEYILSYHVISCNFNQTVFKSKRARKMATAGRILGWGENACNILVGKLKRKRFEKHRRTSGDNIVAYLLKARTMKPEKQTLLANGSGTTFVYRQCLGKHVSTAMNRRATIEVLLETGFSTQSVQGVIRTIEAIQRGLEPECRGIILVRTCYQETSSKTENSRQCVLVNCELWKWALVL